MANIPILYYVPQCQKRIEIEFSKYVYMSIWRILTPYWTIYDRIMIKCVYVGIHNMYIKCMYVQESLNYGSFKDFQSYHGE